MIPKVTKITELQREVSSAVIDGDIQKYRLFPLTGDERDYINSKLEKENNWSFYSHPNIYFFHKSKSDRAIHLLREDARKAGAACFDKMKDEKIKIVQIASFEESGLALSFLEGFLLSGYAFIKYKKDKEHYLPDEIRFYDNQVEAAQLQELQVLIEAVFKARDLVNEPLSCLTAEKLAEEVERMGSEAGFMVEILNSKKIEALKMGGLLAVNRGSIDPPTFTIAEWKPGNAKNKNPIVLAGKGVVYDTGGLSLKPTPNSMDYMKSDMAGAAVVAATIYAAAKNNLPVHLIGLIPATDNRPDGNAYVPGDVITMYDKTTVEIKNTDAEGRLLLADALSYAKKYSPELVIDLATLTGSAEIIAGKNAIVAMAAKTDKLSLLKETGDEVFERLIEVPLWEEFGEPLKSSIADMNNLGTREGQTSIAGKFLEHFTGYPWIHLDIAGVSFLNEKKTYLTAGGTGYGIRLLFNFLKKFN